ncbi:YT521-B-like domain-containing protein [Mycena olivaceomarginata]|nr:YT521-B-like domain-containing protein [Mycena olivaceomarginata]
MTELRYEATLTPKGPAHDPDADGDRGPRHVHALPKQPPPESSIGGDVHASSSLNCCLSLQRRDTHPAPLSAVTYWSQSAPNTCEYTHMAPAFSYALPSIHPGYSMFTMAPQTYPYPTVIIPAAVSSAAAAACDVPSVCACGCVHMPPLVPPSQDAEHRTWWYAPPPLLVSHPHPSSSQNHYGAYNPQQPSVYEPAHHPHPAQREPPLPSRASRSKAHLGTSASRTDPSHGERPAGNTHDRERKDRDCAPNRDRDEDIDTHRAKLLERQPYHPAPPAHRSDWVMWVGNVPSNAKHNKLWRFFTQGPSEGVGRRWVAGNTSATPAPGADITHAFTNTSAPTHGVLSIFLISRSSCAFINYASSLALSAAIERFHDALLRTGDWPGLEDSVGEQRGTGMHAHWVKEREREWENTESAPHSSPASASHSKSEETSTSEESVSANSNGHVPLRPLPRNQTTMGLTDHSHPDGSGDHSSMSTNSSLLARHFPQRFFILKSLTKEDVDLSVQTGVWATQYLNEGVLNHAFHTAVDVFLIFSVNKSGEFYRWASMEGLMRQGKDIASAARGVQAASTAGTTATIRNPVFAEAALHTHTPHDAQSYTFAPQLLSVGRPVTKPPTRVMQSAPTVFGLLSPKHSLDYGLPHTRRHPLDDQHQLMTEEKEEGACRGHGAEHEDVRNESDGVGRQQGGLGQEFVLHWRSTTPLPFMRTRHLQNPWNHGGAVKMSRDGTELEPAVGHPLIKVWT